MRVPKISTLVIIAMPVALITAFAMDQIGIPRLLIGAIMAIAGAIAGFSASRRTRKRR